MYLAGTTTEEVVKTVLKYSAVLTEFSPIAVYECIGAFQAQQGKIVRIVIFILSVPKVQVPQ